MTCPHCGLPLTFLAGRESSTFSCDAGHVFLQDEILKPDPEHVTLQLEKVLKALKGAVETLQELSAQKHSNGGARNGSDGKQAVSRIKRYLKAILSRLSAYVSVIAPLRRDVAS